MPAKGQEEFIDQVGASFQEDDEMALIARDRISTMVNGSEADLREASENLNHGFFSGRKTRLIITLAVLLVGIGTIAYHFKGLDKWGVFSSQDLFFTPEYISLSDRYPHLNEDEKFILFGAPEATSQLEEAESRWRRYPANASYYIQYLQKYRISHEKYPEGMVANGDKIDPENSLYRLCIMSKASDEKAVRNKKYIDPHENETRQERRERIKKEREERNSRRARNKRNEAPPKDADKSSEEPSAGKLFTEPEMVIIDQEKFDNALRLFYEAADKKVCSGYITTLMKERIPLLNTERETLHDHMIPFLYMAHSYSPMLSIMRTSDVLIAEAQRCGREKDAEALKKLIQAHEKISRQLTAEDNVTLLHALVARSYIHRILPHFRDAAAACDLPELEKKYADLFDAFEKDKAVKESAAISAQIIDLRKYGSAISSLTTPLIYNKIRDQSVISPVDHEPLRQVEHAIFSRFAVVVAWLTLVFVALLFCIANRCKNKLTRTLSMRLVGVLGVKDWLLVLLLGIFIPMIFCYFLDRFSPWRITMYNVFYEGGLHSAIRVGTLLVVLICAQTLVLEWRLSRVTDKVFGKQNVWLVWVALITAMATIFMFGKIVDSSDPLMWYALIGMSLFLLIAFIFLRYLPGLFSYKNSIMSRAIVISLVMTATVLTLFIPVYKAEERRWIAKDELLKISPDRAAFSKLEGEVATQLVKETRELLGW